MSGGYSERELAALGAIDRLLDELERHALILAPSSGAGYDYLLELIGRRKAVWEEEHHPIAPPIERGAYIKRRLPARLVRFVLERDAYRCVLCGSWQALSVDHVHPELLGGTDDPGNLQTLCRSCNTSKGARIGR